MSSRSDLVLSDAFLAAARPLGLVKFQLRLDLARKNSKNLTRLASLELITEFRELKDSSQDVGKEEEVNTQEKNQYLVKTYLTGETAGTSTVSSTVLAAGFLPRLGFVSST